MMKGIYEAYDRAGMVRYVGMAFCNVHKRCIHVNRLWCANKNVWDFVRRNGSLTLKCFLCQARLTATFGSKRRGVLHWMGARTLGLARC